MSQESANCTESRERMGRKGRRGKMETDRQKHSRVKCLPLGVCAERIQNMQDLLCLTQTAPSHFPLSGRLLAAPSAPPLLLSMFTTCLPFLSQIHNCSRTTHMSRPRYNCLSGEFGFYLSPCRGKFKRLFHEGFTERQKPGPGRELTAPPGAVSVAY